MNKQQIVEILKHYGVGEDICGLHEKDRFRSDIADEILALHEASHKNDCPKCGESNCLQHGYSVNPDISDAIQGIKFSEPDIAIHEDKCGCKDCKPNMWFQDERGVWCHKIQSFGDEVI